MIGFDDLHTALSDAALKRAGSAEIFERARSYVASGAVVPVSESSIGEDVFRAEVHGTLVYATEVRIGDAADVLPLLQKAISRGPAHALVSCLHALTRAWTVLERADDADDADRASATFASASAPRGWTPCAQPDRGRALRRDVSADADRRPVRLRRRAGRRRARSRAVAATRGCASCTSRSGRSSRRCRGHDRASSGGPRDQPFRQTLTSQRCSSNGRPGGR